jgi:hypothetical protein
MAGEDKKASVGAKTYLVRRRAPLLCSILGRETWIGAKHATPNPNLGSPTQFGQRFGSTLALGASPSAFNLQRPRKFIFSSARGQDKKPRQNRFLCNRKSYLTGFTVYRAVFYETGLSDFFSGFVTRRGQRNCPPIGTTANGFFFFAKRYWNDFLLEK